MDWDLGAWGLLYLAVMSIAFGALAHVLSWRLAPRWFGTLVTAVYFAVGIVVSELWFGWATEDDLQPNIDGLSRDEVLGVGLVVVAVAVLWMRWAVRRRTGDRAGRHHPTPHAP